jgi:hypothetical protein
MPMIQITRHLQEYREVLQTTKPDYQYITQKMAELPVNHAQFPVS